MTIGASATRLDIDPLQVVVADCGTARPGYAHARGPAPGDRTQIPAAGGGDHALSWWRYGAAPGGNRCEITARDPAAVVADN